MRSNFVDGKYLPPPSAEAGKRRKQQLLHEIAKLEHQLADEHFAASFRTPGAHATWRQTAEGNLGWLREEHDQLVAWLASQDPFWGPAPAQVVAPEEDFSDFWRT